MQKYANKPSKYERKTMQDLKYTKKIIFANILWERNAFNIFIRTQKIHTLPFGE